MLCRKYAAFRCCRNLYYTIKQIFHGEIYPLLLCYPPPLLFFSCTMRLSQGDVQLWGGKNWFGASRGKHMHLLNKNTSNIYTAEGGGGKTGQQGTFKIFEIHGTFLYKNIATYNSSAVLLLNARRAKPYCLLILEQTLNTKNPRRKSIFILFRRCILSM